MDTNVNERLQRLEGWTARIWRAVHCIQQSAKRKARNRIGGNARTIPADANSWVYSSIGRTRAVESVATGLALAVDYSGSVSRSRAVDSSSNAFPPASESGLASRSRAVSCSVNAFPVVSVAGAVSRSRAVSAAVVAIANPGGFAVVSAGFGRSRAVSSVNAAYLVVVYPTRWTCWQEESITLSGNPRIPQVYTGQYLNGTCFPTAFANGDSWSNGCFLKGGTYTMSFLGVTYLDAGKIDWSIDGSSVLSGQDWYTAALTPNVIKSVSVVITGNGYHRIVGTVNGKNASSTNYYARISKYWFVPATDTTEIAS